MDCDECGTYTTPIFIHDDIAYYCCGECYKSWKADTDEE